MVINDFACEISIWYEICQTELGYPYALSLSYAYVLLSFKIVGPNEIVASTSAVRANQHHWPSTNAAKLTCIAIK